jgi:hypothetical protein
LTPSQDARIPGNDPLYSPTSCFWVMATAQQKMCWQRRPPQEDSILSIQYATITLRTAIQVTLRAQPLGRCSRSAICRQA